MVDVTPDSDAASPHHLQLVLSPNPTPASSLLLPRRLAALPQAQQDALESIEVSAHGMATAERLAQRIGQHGGAALVIDYGRDAPYADSLMAIRKHEGVDVLSRPGTADLSVWVDFGALRVAAKGSGAQVRGRLAAGGWRLAVGWGSFGVRC
jgi:NADH dehydrogenase [ubiquinone] 1 alpha subcomplex assembly factor 7